MATKINRAISILNAMADPATVDNALALKVANAYAYTYRRGEVLTNEQKAGVFIAALRRMVQQTVTDSETSQAAETARAAAVAGAQISIGTDEI
jgi:hypothetical protein